MPHSHQLPPHCRARLVGMELSLPLPSTCAFNPQSATLNMHPQPEASICILNPQACTLNPRKPKAQRRQHRHARSPRLSRGSSLGRMSVLRHATQRATQCVRIIHTTRHTMRQKDTHLVTHPPCPGWFPVRTRVVKMHDKRHDALAFS
eukprot:365279-Chlamydomonas_euryale.AAC.16